jgi:hypothetical protein
MVIVIVVVTMAFSYIEIGNMAYCTKERPVNFK